MVSFIIGKAKIVVKLHTTTQIQINPILLHVAYYH